jgi:hypothetical protein
MAYRKRREMKESEEEERKWRKQPAKWQKREENISGIEAYNVKAANENRIIIWRLINSDHQAKKYRHSTIICHISACRK